MWTDKGHHPGNAQGHHDMPAAQGWFRLKTKDAQFLRPHDISPNSAAKQSKSCQSKWCLSVQMKSCMVRSTLSILKAYFSFIPPKLCSYTQKPCQPPATTVTCNAEGDRRVSLLLTAMCLVLFLQSRVLILIVCSI